MESVERLRGLLKCGQCGSLLELPVTLPCGNSLCYDCLKAHVASHRNITQSSGNEHDSAASEGPPSSPTSPTITAQSTRSTSFSSSSSLAARFPAYYLSDLSPQPTLQRQTFFQCPFACSSENHGFDVLRVDITLKAIIDCSKPLLEKNIVTPRSVEDMDSIIRGALSESIECQICYSIFLIPVTSHCGHTFCKSCLYRSLDHSFQCPSCRALLPPPSAISAASPNKTLQTFLATIYPDLVALRSMESDALHSRFVGPPGSTGTYIPLFICTLAFPRMPTFLHIFEPRYRLMVRRCMEGNRLFGMVVPPISGEVDNETLPCAVYGTVLEVKTVELLPDGRSLVETVGKYRFKMDMSDAAAGDEPFYYRDGYLVGRVSTFDDISQDDEKALEQEEVNQKSDQMPMDEPLGAQQTFDVANLERESTSHLIAHARDFILSLRHDSAPWLLRRVTSTYGEVPDNDAQGFCWWLASVIPVDEYEKYDLLKVRNLRHRYITLCRWINNLERQWW